MRIRLLALTALLALAAPARAGKSDIYALVGAKLVTVSGATLETGTLVLRAGVIEALGPNLAPPPDARVIDAKGLTLTPGLIDGFGGVGLPQPPRPGPGGGSPGATPAPAASAAPSLQPQAMALDRLRTTEALRARDSGITTALVIPREGVLPGQSVLIDLSGESAAGMVLKQPAALHLHLATLSRQYPTSLMGTLAYARQSLLDAAHYRDEWSAYERAPLGRTRPKYDAAKAAWQDVLTGKQTLIVTAIRENDVRRALSLQDEFKLRLLVAGAPQAHRVSALIKERKLPLLVTVNFDPPRPAGFSFFGGGGDDEREKRDIAEAETNPAELHKAGVPFGLVSGHAPSFVAGLRKAIERGLPREAALAAATLGVAQALGIADRTGSLEVGKLANVVAWSGEPLAKDSKVKLVFVDGQLYEPGEEDRAPGTPGRPSSGGEARGSEGSAAPEPALPAAPPPRAAPAEPGRTLAITGGTILTVAARGTLERGTVLIRDGKIAAVGKEVQVPAGARVIDATGRVVMPGIIDAHSHTAIEGGVNEGSDIVTAEVRIRDVIDPNDVGIYRELAGGVTTINALHGSANAIGGQNAVLKLRLGKPAEELVFKEAPPGIKFALGENPKRASFNVPGQPRRYPATRMGVEAAIRGAFEEARAYKAAWDEHEKKLKRLPAKADKPLPPRRELRLETLQGVLEGRILVHAHCYRADEILMLIRLADEFGFKIRTFQHVLEGYKVATEIARHGAGASTFSDWWAYKMEAYDAIPYNAAIMASHGVVVSLNSDSDELARRLYWEGAKAVKYGGVSESEALEMITLNPALQLGVEKRVGSLEVGKDADVAIFNAHPFAPDARVEMTLVDGVVVFDRAADLAARSAKASPAGGGQ